MKIRVLIATAAFLGMLGTAPAQESVGIASMSPGSNFHTAGTALAKLANEKIGIRATIQPFASPSVFIPAINSGEIQFGIGSLYEAMIGYEGTEYFNGRPNPELRAVAITFPIQGAVYVRKDSPYKKLSDLKGLRAPDGFSSQRFMVQVIAAIYATSGLSRADFKPVFVPNVLGSADAFMSGKVDFFSYAVGAAKVREVDAAVGGLRAISLEHSPEALQRLRKHFAVGYLQRVEPIPENVAILEPVYCYAHDGIVFTNAKVSEDLVYKMTKMMYENKAELVSIAPILNLFEPKDMVKKIPLPYHPGAIKFYKEKGMWPPK